MDESFDLSWVAEGLRGVSPPLRLTLHTADGDTPLGDRLADLARELATQAPDEVVLEPSDAEVPAKPALTLSAPDGNRSLHYLALPMGPESAPFREAVLGLVGRGEAAGPELAELDRPADLTVFIAAACPHCPQAVRAAHRVALATDGLTVSVVDAQFFPELAERHGVQSVPTTVLDGEGSRTGVIPAIELAAWIASRGTAAFERQALLTLVEESRFDEATRQILEARGAEHFAALWRGSATSLRMGLQLLAEEALEAAPSALDAVVPELLPLLGPEHERPLRGDTAYLLGIIGAAEAQQPLRALLEDPDPEVVEAAEEALEELAER